MNERELAAIHRALWDDHPPKVLSFRGNIYPVTVRDDNRRRFRSVKIGEIQVITQNLKKDTKWTSWVRQHKGGKITWVLKGSSYIGRAESWVQDGVEHIKVVKLRPERTLLHHIADVA